MSAACCRRISPAVAANLQTLLHILVLLIWPLLTSSMKARCHRAGRHGAPPDDERRMGRGEAPPPC